MRSPSTRGLSRRISLAAALWLATVVLVSSTSSLGEVSRADRASQRRRRLSTSGMAAAALDDSLSPEIDLDAPDAPPGVLMLPGKKFPLDYAGGELRVHDVPLLVREVPNTGAGTGLNIWDGAAVLTKYLEHSGLDLSDKRVLEVGAGTGLVGIAASVLGAGCVLLTDLEYTLNNTAANVAANEPSLRGRVHTAELDWFRPASAGSPVAALAQRPHYILGADVVWIDSLIEPLVKTLAWATQPPASAKPSEGLAASAAVSVSSDGTSARVGTEFDPDASVTAAAPHGVGGSAPESKRLYSSHGPPPSVAGSCGGSSVEGLLPSAPARRGSGSSATRRDEAASVPASVHATAAAETALPASAGADGGPIDGSSSTVILLAHQTRARSSDALLFRLLDEHGFEWRPLPHSDMHPRFQDADINIFRIVRR